MHILNCTWLQIQSQLEGSVLPSVKSRIKCLLIELLQYTIIKTGRPFQHQPVATLCIHV